MKYFDKSSVLNNIKWQSRPITDQSDSFEDRLKSQMKKKNREMRDAIKTLENRIILKCDKSCLIWWSCLNSEDKEKLYSDYRYKHLIKHKCSDSTFRDNIKILKTLVKGDIVINRDLIIKEILNEI